jgi:hypothetical protein
MKRLLAIATATIFPVLAVATVVSFAQQPQPATQGNIVVKQRVVQGQEGVPAPPTPDFVYFATDFAFSGKVVKGAPYSAQAVTETIQTLGDGNRIVNKTTSQQYRDSEGRTRREQTIKMFGNLAENTEPLQTIFINDPVAGVSYALDSKTHVARKTAPFKFEKGVPVPAGAVTGGPGGEAQRFEFKVESGTSSTVVVKGAPGALPPDLPAIPPNGVGVSTGHVFNIQTDSGGAGGNTFMFRRSGPNENEVKEQLGKQIIEGVEAEGNRSTVTIPAGEIGNERAIEIVSESWYSPELQMVVMTRHTDPRFGETTYRLTNINRTEPVKSLFEVPADYTVKEGMPGAPAMVTMPMRVRKPE